MITADEGQRKLAAILVADVVGYSRLMADDERATVAALKTARVVFKDQIEAHAGRLIDTAGDSILAEFKSVVEAVHCAVDVQQRMVTVNQDVAESRQMFFRVGLNLGDVIEESDGTIYGDGVNIAARLEGLAEPGGVIISEDVYRQVRQKVGFGFQDSGRHTVKNIAEPVQTYRLTGQEEASIEPRYQHVALYVPLAIVALVIVSVVGWQLTQTSEPEIEAESPDRMALSLPEKPSIAVLPFDNLSGDPTQEYFADGITEEVISALARLPDLGVIARNSTFRYKGEAVDVRVVGAELDVAYIVEGSVRRGGDTIRVTALLVDALTGSDLWTATYNRALTPENLFAIQDDIASAIANTVAGDHGVLRQQAFAVAKRKPPSELSSYECVMLAMEWQRRISRASHSAARACLEKVVENDPDYAAAWSHLANILIYADNLGYDTGPGVLDRALAAANRSVELAPGDPLAHWVLAWVHFFRGELDEFKVGLERAVDRAPRGASFLGNAGLFVAYAGEWERGLALIEEAKAFDPYFPSGYHFGAFFDHYRKGAYKQALVTAQQVNLPEYVWAQALIAAAYGQLGQVDEAEPVVERILILDPEFEMTARANRWKWFRYQEELLDQFMDGLRKSGLDIRGEVVVSDGSTR